MTEEKKAVKEAPKEAKAFLTEELAIRQGQLYQQIMAINNELRNINIEIQERLERVKDGKGRDA
jgi:hypothetical protein